MLTFTSRDEPIPDQRRRQSEHGGLSIGRAKDDGGFGRS
ncbi:hypothetical protein LINPERHAP1_LOCUS28926, partial [Linum perenne]